MEGVPGRASRKESQVGGQPAGQPGAQTPERADVGSEKKRLSADDWIHAAIRGLLAEGPGALRVAKLARALGVTPGSFYWHFRDRYDLRDRLLRYWMDEKLRGVVAAACTGSTGDEQIRALPALLLDRQLPELDMAIRRWAREDAAVRSALRRADDLRIRMVSDLFEQTGLDPELATLRAHLVAWAFRGSAGVDRRKRLAALADLVESLLPRAC
jgi:AcrR family transcriptional regulator